MAAAQQASPQNTKKTIPAQAQVPKDRGCISKEVQLQEPSSEASTPDQLMGPGGADQEANS